MKFKALIIESVDRFLHDYDCKGFIVAGCNGPHNTPETALRNSSRWIIALVRAFQRTGNEVYGTTAVKIRSSLLDESFCTKGFSFNARQCKGLDHCDGLIGQAWVLGALAQLHNLTTNSVYRNFGIQLSKQHQLDRHISVWHSPDVEDAVLNIDNVFNHQRWFCATVGLINRGYDKVLNERVQAFMDSLHANLSVSESGLIHHHIIQIMKSPRARFLTTFLKGWKSQSRMCWESGNVQKNRTS